MGFAEAGFQIKEVFIKDRKAIEIYGKNIGGKICESGLLELLPEEISDVDVIAIDLMQMFISKNGGKNVLGSHQIIKEPLKKTVDIIMWKRPRIFFLVMQKRMYKNPAWSGFCSEICQVGYKISWRVLSSREITGFPVTEEQLYVVGSRMPDDQYEFPEYRDLEVTIPVRKFISDIEEDRWYYRINGNEIPEKSKEDSFLCWRKDRYVEQPYVGWNLIKIPLVRVDGTIRRLSHKDMAGLKGFPKNFDLTISNREWLYRMLVYAPNVQVVKYVAGNLTQTPLRKQQMTGYMEFEQIFSSYLQQKGGEIKNFTEQDAGVDIVYTYNNSTVYFALKFYSSDFSMRENLCKASLRLSKGGKEGNCIVLAVANIVSEEIKEVCKSEYGINIWDVKNLLWLFREFTRIENEFIAFLNYSTEIIEPQKPELHIFGEIEKKTEDKSLKEKLLQIKPGTGQWQQYEKVCIEILKYVLGDYLTLWYTQENTDNGMYRFDLCCKIKAGSNQDFFDTVQQYFNTKYIVFEFKNYNKKITQKEIYTTEKYLYEKALRRVAIIISREGADENALAAVRGSLRESGKLILCLSDRDILEMIEIKERNEQPTEAFLGAMLDDLLIHLEK
ncbi:MAG: hypothetical protein NC429_16000 [Lachnospiraceae bacterium]|nr:hypothetical protein [Lachnospiraceae bacterium]